MTLIVAPADGYDALVSVTDADSYATNMGLAWVGETEAKEAAIRRATQYLMARYRIKPEYLNPVHDNVQAACVEVAAKAIVGPLYQDVDASVVTSETVGPISVSYSASQRNGGQVRFAIVDDLLVGMADVRRGMVRLMLA